LPYEASSNHGDPDWPAFFLSGFQCFINYYHAQIPPLADVFWVKTLKNRPSRRTQYSSSGN
jgi:hypothetical protein